tara:strand:+ start:115 stop:279 length:165 start_codon:yes stop_codon:yes gene_type:complete
MELFNNSYLPDRLDVSPNGQQSIFFHEWLEAEKRANNHSFINRVINRIKNKIGA